MPPIETHGLTAKELEATLILETGENLGLSAVHEREKTLEEIKLRLLN